MELLECRTCLTKDTLGKMLPIFGDSEALVQKIYDCTGIKVSYGIIIKKTAYFIFMLML